MSDKKYRLVTRADFDGIVAAVLLKELDMISEVKFVHPKDMQDGKVDISDNDITTNLPYVDGVHLCFDHHLSETIRVGKKDNHVIDAAAPSAARVVYSYYGGAKTFPHIPNGLMEAVDQADSAQYSSEDILAPTGWTMLNFLLDPRTGLGRFRDFAVSNDQLMMDMIIYCRQHPVEEILRIPDVRERLELYIAHDEDAEFQLRRCSAVNGKVVVIDLREEEVIYPVNRFMIYALNPEAAVSIHVMWGLRKEVTVFAVGKSIINRASKTNIGELMLKYGGGGHVAAGTCQVDNAHADHVRQQIIDRINADG
ncbi:MAG: exopolyphosphatase [Rhodospirillales bacterium RIFCSPLOWO2_12_FULL_58_28]|nr:MAG: exopolyphosphatase [Rhodospirillales bacterium RIFCSPLOWO2_02_FULL_58_16]OHC77269.1 MAG: exopolyphosphatase [Rhodospirillales bacterium RIFCSPLOWO2_12_FULL_58_28]